MKGKVFLIHWSAPEAEEYAKPLRQDGWEVAVEAEEGARAVRQIMGVVPDVMVVYLSRLPSHGIGTAYYVRSSIRQTRNLPIIFVGGEENTVAKARDKVPDAICVAAPDLEKTLGRLSK